MSVTKKYFNKDYWEAGTKSGYTTKTYNSGDYLHEAKARLLIEVYGKEGEWLEAGCAFGWVVEQLIEMDVHAYGFDISKHSIKDCPSWIKDNLERSDGLSQGIYFSGKFDIIHSFETAEHVAEDDVPKWMANLYTWLKPGGKLFMTICLGHNNIRGLNDNDESHQTLQPRLWWENILEDAGFIRDQVSFDKASSTIIETEEMSIRGTPENIIEAYGLHLFTWEKP